MEISYIELLSSSHSPVWELLLSFLSLKDTYSLHSATKCLYNQKIQYRQLLMTKIERYIKIEQQKLKTHISHNFFRFTSEILDTFVRRAIFTQSSVHLEFIAKCVDKQLKLIKRINVLNFYIIHGNNVQNIKIRVNHNCFNILRDLKAFLVILNLISISTFGQINWNLGNIDQLVHGQLIAFSKLNKPLFKECDQEISKHRTRCTQLCPIILQDAYELHHHLSKAFSIDHDNFFRIPVDAQFLYHKILHVNNEREPFNNIPYSICSIPSKIMSLPIVEMEGFWPTPEEFKNYIKIATESVPRIRIPNFLNL